MSGFRPILAFAALFFVVALMIGAMSIVRRQRSSASPVRRADRGRVRYWLKHRSWPRDDA